MIRRTGNDIRDMFTSIAARYDLANRLISLGMDRCWRQEVLRQVALLPGDRVLDLCCGTGDLTVAIGRRLGGSGRVMGVDFSAEMLRYAQAKAERAFPSDPGRCQFTVGEASSLPFPDDCFSVVTVAFGLRNVDDLSACLAEAYRVLSVGGMFISLELFPGTSSGLRRAADLYTSNVAPLIGGLVTGNREAYKYLADSISAFLTPEQLCSCMCAAGFSSVRRLPAFLDLVYLHQGRKRC